MAKPESISDMFPQVKRSALERLLQGGKDGVLDEKKLRGITSTGVPDVGCLRPVLWRFLLRCALSGKCAPRCSYPSSARGGASIQLLFSVDGLGWILLEMGLRGHCHGARLGETPLCPDEYTTTLSLWSVVKSTIFQILLFMIDNFSTALVLFCILFPLLL